MARSKTVKNKRKPKKTGRRKPPAVVFSPSELGIHEALAKVMGVPVAIAERGFYIVPQKHAEKVTLFERYPESTKLSKKASAAGFSLLSLLSDTNRDLTTTADGELAMGFKFSTRQIEPALSIGFHADLSSDKVREAFAKDGFRVTGAECFASAARLSEEIICRLDRPKVWLFVEALLATKGDAIDTSPLIAGLSQAFDDEHVVRLTPKQSKILHALVRHAEPASWGSCASLLRICGQDLVDPAIDLFKTLAQERTWPVPSRRKRLTPKMKRELGARAEVLAQLGRLPIGGLLTPAEIIEEQRFFRDNGYIKKTRGHYPPETCDYRVRKNQHWREGWLPFWSSGGGDYLVIDGEPSRDGTSGQIVGVWRNPPGLHWEADEIGAWTWKQLISIEKGLASYDQEEQLYSVTLEA